MLSAFSHNRDKDLQEEIVGFKDCIETFSNASALEPYYQYCANSLGVSQECVKQEFKKQAAEAYNWKDAKFPQKLVLSGTVKYLFKTYAYLFYALIHSRIGRKKQKCDLLIEWIETDLEAKRFQKLFEKFENPLMVTVNPIESKCRSIYRPAYKLYDTRLVLEALFNISFFGTFRLFEASLKTKTNVFAIHLILLDKHLYYSSLFKIVNARHLIQERHYQTSSIKSFLFKKYGGESCSTIQKNIIHGGYSGFYYDVDNFFSLGTGTHQRAVYQGGVLRNVVPVGSLFMEYSWFTIGGRMPSKKYDVIYLGLNMIDFHNSYSKYIPDYYEHIQWMADFADKYPEYSVGIKHHSNNPADPREKNIIKNSKLFDISNEFNSYEHAFAAKCTLSWGSTMGYELLGHNISCLFLDPGKRDFGFLPYDKELDPYRVTSYDEFEKALLQILSRDSRKDEIVGREFFCLDSENTANRIWKHLAGHSAQ